MHFLYLKLRQNKQFFKTKQKTNNKSVNILYNVLVVPYFGCDNNIHHDFKNVYAFYCKIIFSGAGGDKLEYLHGAVISQPEPGVA